MRAQRAAATDPYLPGLVDGGLDVARYELDLDYRVASNRLDGRARVHARVRTAGDRIALDLAGLRASAVLVDGRKPLRWSHRDGRIVVRAAQPWAANATVVLDITYAGNPRPRRGPWGEVGWEELEDGVIVAGQPDGAPSWFPCHDHPSDKSSFRIAITTDAGYEVACNGVLTSRTVRSSRVRWVFEQPEPTAAYLATVQVGRYVRSTLVSPRTGEPAGPDVPLHVLAPAALRDRVAHDLGRQPRMVQLFSRLFGPYPFAEYTVVVTPDVLEIPLEAHGLSVFGSNHMDGRHGSERLVAHELAHSWFGNSLTVATWRDIWLHEGFACYAEWLWADHLWASDEGGRPVEESARLAYARLAALPQDLVVADPGRDAMFDDRVYQRGALTLHAIRRAVGDVAFFDMLRTWTARHRHAHVSTLELVGLASQVTGVDVAPVVEAWAGSAQLPEPGSWLTR